MKGVRIGSVIALALSGCAVGPNFKPPPPPAIDAYTTRALPSHTVATGTRGGEAQRFQVGRDLPGQWWVLFGSSSLVALIQEAMVNYPDIAAQQAALRVAMENVRAQDGAFFPQIRGTASQEREKINRASIVPGLPGFITTSIYQATVNVSYAFDLFGGERRTVEALQAQAVAQNFQLEASYVTLTSNVALTAIQLASVREQIAATHEIIAIENRQLAMIQRQFEFGSHTRADVLQQQSNLATVRATLPPMQQQKAAAEHQLAVLTGHFPHDAALVEFDLTDLTLPQDLPVSLPSSLVEQRPDIKSQEALLHQASAAIGVATANMLPQLTLSASTGDEALQFANLLKPTSGVWNMATGISQPIFEGGTLRAKRRAARDAYDQAAEQYRLTVLYAFQNVADTLTALDNDAQAFSANYDAVNAAKASLDLTQRQYNDGAVNFVSLLTAQQFYEQARIAYVRAAANRFTDTITLFQALGGGWWNRSDPGTLQSASSDSRTLDARK